MKRRGAGVVWPQRLAVCVPEEWHVPGEDRGADFWWYDCWKRWVSARYEHLLTLGWAPQDAQVEAVGAMPGVAA